MIGHLEEVKKVTEINTEKFTEENKNVSVSLNNEASNEVAQSGYENRIVVPKNEIKVLPVAQPVPGNQQIEEHKDETIEGYRNALKKEGIDIPDEDLSLERLVMVRIQHSEQVKEKDENGNDKVVDSRYKDNVSVEAQKNLDALIDYVKAHDASMEEKMGEMKKRPLNLNRTVSVNFPAKNYEYQGMNNCFCCSGAAMINQFLKTKGKVGKFTQHDMRKFRSGFKKYDPSFSRFADEEDYLKVMLEVDGYAGLDEQKREKTEVGNVFQMGDFFLENLKDENACLNRMQFILLEENAENVKSAEERDLRNHNMRAAFMDKLNEVLSTGNVVSFLETYGGDGGHYITITGIKGNNIEYLDSLEADPAKRKKTRTVDDLLWIPQNRGRSVEIAWLSEMKPPEEMKKEYSNLEYDKNTGYSVKEAISENVLNPMHTRGLEIRKEQRKDPGALPDITLTAYIPNPLKKVETETIEELAVRIAEKNGEKVKEEEQKKEEKQKKNEEQKKASQEKIAAARKKLREERKKLFEEVWDEQQKEDQKSREKKQGENEEVKNTGKGPLLMSDKTEEKKTVKETEKKTAKEDKQATKEDKKAAKAAEKKAAERAKKAAKKITDYEKQSKDYEKFGVGFSLDKAQINAADSEYMRAVKISLQNYLKIRAWIFEKNGIFEETALERHEREKEEKQYTTSSKPKPSYEEIREDDREELGKAYEQLEQAIGDYQLQNVRPFKFGRGAARIRQVRLIEDRIHMDNKRYFLSDTRRGLLDSVDRKYQETQTDGWWEKKRKGMMPTWTKLVRASDNISNRNEVYREKRQKQREEGTLPNVFVRMWEWMKTASKNNLYRGIMGYEAVGGLIDRGLGLATMLAANSLELAGKVVKAPIKLLSMCFNGIAKLAHSRKRWKVDYSLTKGWKSLDDGRQIFRRYLKGAFIIPTAIVESMKSANTATWNLLTKGKVGDAFKNPLPTTRRWTNAILKDFKKVGKSIGIKDYTADRADADKEMAGSYIDRTDEEGDLQKVKDDEEGNLQEVYALDKDEARKLKETDEEGDLQKTNVIKGDEEVKEPKEKETQEKTQITTQKRRRRKKKKKSGNEQREQAPEGWVMAEQPKAQTVGEEKQSIRAAGDRFLDRFIELYPTIVRQFTDASKGADKDSISKNAVDNACEVVRAVYEKKQNGEDISALRLTNALCTLSEAVDGYYDAHRGHLTTDYGKSKKNIALRLRTLVRNALKEMTGDEIEQRVMSDGKALTLDPTSNKDKKYIESEVPDRMNELVKHYRFTTAWLAKGVTGGMERMRQKLSLMRPYEEYIRAYRYTHSRTEAEESSKQREIWKVIEDYETCLRWEYLSGWAEKNDNAKAQDQQKTRDERIRGHLDALEEKKAENRLSPEEVDADLSPEQLKGIEEIDRWLIRNSHNGGLAGLIGIRKKYTAFVAQVLSKTKRERLHMYYLVQTRARKNPSHLDVGVSQTVFVPDLNAFKDQMLASKWWPLSRRTGNYLYMHKMSEAFRETEDYSEEIKNTSLITKNYFSDKKAVAGGNASEAAASRMAAMEEFYAFLKDYRVVLQKGAKAKGDKRQALEEQAKQMAAEGKAKLRRVVKADREVMEQMKDMKLYNPEDNSEQTDQVNRKSPTAGNIFLHGKVTGKLGKVSGVAKNMQQSNRYLDWGWGLDQAGWEKVELWGNGFSSAGAVVSGLITSAASIYSLAMTGRSMVGVDVAQTFASLAKTALSTGASIWSGVLHFKDTAAFAEAAVKSKDLLSEAVKTATRSPAALTGLTIGAAALSGVIATTEWVGYKKMGTHAKSAKEYFNQKRASADMRGEEINEKQTRYEKNLLKLADRLRAKKKKSAVMSTISAGLAGVAFVPLVGTAIAGVGGMAVAITSFVMGLSDKKKLKTKLFDDYFELDALTEELINAGNAEGGMSYPMGKKAKKAFKSSLRRQIATAAGFCDVSAGQDYITKQYATLIYGRLFAEDTSELERDAYIELVRALGLSYNREKKRPELGALAAKMKG